MHPKHPKKEVNAALDYADSLQFAVERTVAGHKWGRIMCTCRAWVSVGRLREAPTIMGGSCVDGSISTTTVPMRRRHE